MTHTVISVIIRIDKIFSRRFYKNFMWKDFYKKIVEFIQRYFIIGYEFHISKNFMKFIRKERA